MELRCGRNSVTPQIEAFREQLKGIDQTIQDYEKMLNGEMEMPTKLAGGPFTLNKHRCCIYLPVQYSNKNQ